MFMKFSRPHAAAPFALELEVPTADAEAHLARVMESGAAQVEALVLELARILAGWPRLGAEIDQRTLPQEVRYDDISGVSYTKGCYTGQETVARVHFRGHPNRVLAGLVWEGEPQIVTPAIQLAGKDVGRVTSIAWLSTSGGYLGLGLLRREVEPGAVVLAAGARARVVHAGALANEASPASRADRP